MFQKTIQNKYIKKQDDISEKWGLFKNHFHNEKVQKNIRNSKEEQYQEGFLRDLFVQIFGYTLNPDKDFNLTTELKNIKDSKKADGAIIINEQVKAIIELKGTNTTDLGKVEAQAFGYKNNQENCSYVIISNFEKLRFYIDNAINHIEFNLFTLTQEDFKLLYLLLSLDSIKNDIPKKLKTESISQEDIITKKLYKDYSVFKRELFANLCELNPQQNKLLLFKKSQKLLDRFLFLFFAEDSHLLPPNSVRKILKQWVQLKELDAYTPLYERFKKYFGYLNTGYKGKKHDIFAYNGGLFKPDEILDLVKIDDEILYNHTKTLSEYDFNSEVDVNILGHIFENSLNEIEEVEAQLTPIDLNPLKNPLKLGKVSKRKKDGVFYTPKYITQYIVENTIGKLCNKKKEELNIIEEEYFKGTNSLKRKRNKKTITALLQKLKKYRKWLLELTICDPACGSGAFLNEALNFLITEHKYLDELETKLLGGGFTFPNIENSILENNIFGVDINEESVEIAKLSLWLRTAQPQRKLNNLNENIKCGNSLIDDTEIAGKKAFNWQQEFPKVFKEKKAYHLVFTTHNSRISARMKQYKIVPGKPAELSLPQEIQLAYIFAEIVKNYNLEITAFNICKDHIHILLVCAEDELYDQVRMMKSISSKKLNEWMNTDVLTTKKDDTTEHPNTSMGLDPLQYARLQEALKNSGSYFPAEHNNHLWSQKFFSVDTKSWQWIQDIDSGFPYVATHFTNAIDYIQGNRDKHQLPKSKELESIIKGFVKTPEDVFSKKYKGGFDVVIGNPPYVLMQPSNTSKTLLDFYKKFQVASYKIDLFHLFFEKSIHLLKHKSKLGFITPNTYLNNKYIKPLRLFILEETFINSIVNYKDQIFADAGVDVATIILTKENLSNDKIETFEVESSIIKPLSLKKQSDWFNDKENIFNLNKSFEIEFRNCIELQKICSSYFGIQAFDKKSSIAEEKINSNYLPIIDGGDINEFSFAQPTKYFNFLPKNIKSGGNINVYREKRIVISQIGFTPIVGLCDAGNLASNTLYNINLTDNSYNLNYLLCILNSNLLKCYWIAKYSDGKKLFPKIKGFQLKELPIKKATKEQQQPFIEKADQMLQLNKTLQQISAKFKRTLQRRLFPPPPMGLNPLKKTPLKLSKNLEIWYTLSFPEFVKELKKKKIKLSLSEEADWEDYFLTEQKKALAVQTQINKTDKEIDTMVYKLYGLSEEEIKTIEEI